MNVKPHLVAIDHDDHHAEHVGTTSDGRQFFCTRPFVPGGDEFIALYLFDAAGALLEARIHDLGPRGTYDAPAAESVERTFLESLGPVTHERITVAPFAVMHNGIEFGLVPREEYEEWQVTAQPGDVMAFFEPWDSGIYDT